MTPPSRSGPSAPAWRAASLTGSAAWQTEVRPDLAPPYTGTAAAGPRRTSSATSGNVVSSASRRSRRPRRGWRSRRPRTRPCSPWPRPPAASWRGTVCWPGGWCWARSGSEVTAPRCGRSPAGGPAPPRPPGRAARRSSAA